MLGTKRNKLCNTIFENASDLYCEQKKHHYSCNIMTIAFLESMESWDQNFKM